MAAYLNGTVVVGSTVTLITTVQAYNDGILISNQGTVTVYVGGPSVTADQNATGGFPVVAGATVTIPSVGGTTHDLYGITASPGSAKVSFIQPTSVRRLN
jgi:hypothetical protein